MEIIKSVDVARLPFAYTQGTYVQAVDPRPQLGPLCSFFRWCHAPAQTFSFPSLVRSRSPDLLGSAETMGLRHCHTLIPGKNIKPAAILVRSLLLPTLVHPIDRWRLLGNLAAAFSGPKPERDGPMSRDHLAITKFFYGSGFVQPTD